MAKQLKLKIKNIQLAQAAGLEKEKPSPEKVKEKAKTQITPPAPTEEPPPRRRAKTKSAFAHIEEEEVKPKEEIKEENKVEELELEGQVLVTKLPSADESLVIEESKSEVKPPFSKVEKRGEPRGEQKLGPTGRHVKDLYTPTKREPAPKLAPAEETKPAEKAPPSPAATTPAATAFVEEEDKSTKKKVREYKDLKPAKRELRPFDARDRQGLSEGEEERWRKKRPLKGQKRAFEEPIIRPNKLKIRIPISVKDLASEMKLKSSELIQKLLMQGAAYTVNDLLNDEATILFIGAEFGCDIAIDRVEEDRIQITKNTIQEEIASSDPKKLVIRPPVVAFMGHVDHGKTSLIDAIRKSNIVKTEAGAITQHIGAFRCKTASGDITILDTPGHEAFSAMRARGAEVTDIVVLVVAGDEGIREQTLEAIQHAKAAHVTIVVAINKSDKPNFNPENIYRQLADADLLPEIWGGQVVTVNTSAVTGEGIVQLLEMLALQSEVLELHANPHTRARGTVLESELHKGFGATATILIQNGTLRKGDAIVLENLWGRVKTMRDEYGNFLEEAGPATPVEIAGLSGVPEAGDPFIVVKNEKEAREIAEVRATGTKAKAMMQKKPVSLENLLQEDSAKGKKILKLIVRGDVQGSVEALKATLLKIHSEKVDLDVIFTGVGDVTESDAQLAAASNAVILGFHTQVESHATSLIKELGVVVRLHDIIYHAVDDVKGLMQGLLDKIAEEKLAGRAEVRAIFKASQLGIIAGCIVIEGAIIRSHHIRVERGGKTIWKGSIASLKREKEDVREVKKGLECGILLQNFNDVQVGDFLQTYEIIYLTQEI